MCVITVLASAIISTVMPCMHFHSFSRLFIRISLNSGTAGRYIHIHTGELEHIAVICHFRLYIHTGELEHIAVVCHFRFLLVS